MKTLKLITAIIITMISLQSKATQQVVTGSVTLIDTSQHILPNGGGVMVIFQVQGSPGTSDTTYTDANGNYTDTLQQGVYTPYLYKTGFAGKQLTNIVISGGAVPIPITVLYQLLPRIDLAGPLSGTLQPFTIYYTIRDSIRAGDTLIVPEGAWLVCSEGIEIKGCLIVQGTTAHPAFFLAGDSASGGFQQAWYINVDSGGTLIVDNAQLPSCNLSANNATIQLSHVNDLLNVSNWLTPTSQFYVRYSVINSSLTISDSYIHGPIRAQTFSTVNLFCNEFSFIGTHSIESGSTLDNEDNFYDSCGVVLINSVTSAIFRNNYFATLVWGQGTVPISIENSVPAAPINVELTNNSFPDDGYQTPVFLQSGNMNLRLVNNLGLVFAMEWDTLTGINIVESRYNILYPMHSVDDTDQHYYPTFSSLPTGVSRFELGTYVNIDTFDANNNRYSTNILPIFDTFPNYYAQDTTLFLHAGDPTLTNADGSRSNIGAFRNTVGCVNRYIPVPHSTGTATVVTYLDSVWPGDANYDGICNNIDVLPIGVKYGATGPVRANASLVWTPQYCAQWNDSLASHRNIKHVDCNGDGTIDYTDINAIYQNYSLTHALAPKAGSFGDGLWLQFPSDSIFNGDTIAVAVMLGTHTQPVSNIYGLAFSLTYDSAFIKPGSARMTFQPCWMGTDSVNMISFFKEIIPSTRYDMALARTDHHNITGSGQIGNLVIVINDDIQAKSFATLTTQLTFSGIYAIDSIERHLNIGSAPGEFNVQIGQRSTTGIKGLTDEKLLTVYPNPANDKLIISLQGITKAQVSLSSPDGRKVMSMEMTNEKQEMDISTLPPGFYILKFEHNGNTVCRKVIIAR